mmetsp:Transcript_39443/g.85083  ORF Transcript_39443/g.85083 Transcript_39443/m.85083 type:complete len:226 (-) Transcript_39443:5-682(-)
MVRGVAPGIDDVIHGIAGRHALGLRDLSDALGAEGALGVDVDHLAVGTAHTGGKLRDDRKGMTQLGLATTELPKDLRNRAALHTTTKHLVQLPCTSGNLKSALHLAHKLCTGHEANFAGLPGSFDDLVHLLIGETLDAQQLLAHGKGHRLRGVEARVFQLLQICRVDSRLLKLVDEAVGHHLLTIICFHHGHGTHSAGLPFLRAFHGHSCHCNRVSINSASAKRG